MIGGTAVQTVILAYITMKCDWDEEVGLSMFFASMIFSPCSWKCISTICDPCRSSIRCLCCFFAGEDSKYENAEMGRLKIKLLDQYRCTLLPRHVRGTLELSNDQGNSRYKEKTKIRSSPVCISENKSRVQRDSLVPLFWIFERESFNI